jgi:RNA polymerase sigma-70 factor (ECF subfamily)
MAGKPDGVKITQAYQAHRPYLLDLAFRMLGEIGAAQDVVQEAFARLMGATAGPIEDERGWLIVVTSRLCLDQLRSARFRRESTHDAAKIEFIAPPAGTDPADRVTLDDSVGLALLIVLQRLSPAERVAFVLHDIFQVPFQVIAETVGRAAPACRQLAVRARQKIAASGDGAPLAIASAEHRLVTDKFIAACATGDLDGLLAVLAPDAWGEVDLGPDAGGVPGVVTGAERVAGNLLRFWGRGAVLVSVPAGGQCAMLGFRGRTLAGVLVFSMRGQVIEAVHVIGDPHKLALLRRQLTVPGLAS